MRTWPLSLCGDLNIGLVPRQPKAAVEHVGKRRIFRAVGQQRAALHGEQVKSQPRTDAVQVKNQRVIDLAADHGRARPWLLSVIGPQAANSIWIRYQVKGDLVVLLCIRNAGECQRRAASSNPPAILRADCASQVFLVRFSFTYFSLLCCRTLLDCFPWFLLSSLYFADLQSDVLQNHPAFISTFLSDRGRLRAVLDPEKL